MLYFMSRLMQRKSLPILVLACFYFSSVLLNAACTTPASHMHHQKRGVSHSFGCLMACSSTVADHCAAPFIPSSLPLLGALFLSAFFLFYQPEPSILRSRGPPLIF